jgi:protease secretion system membrane fusion protein
LAEIQSIEENILGQEGMIQAYAEMLINRKQQKALLADELANTKTLVSEGYAPRNRQLELERMSSEISSGLAELQGNTIRARRSVSEPAARYRSAPGCQKRG